MTTTQNVLNAIVATLKRIKVANGYQNNLPDANVFDRFTSSNMEQKSDSFYPKAMAFLNEGKTTLEPNNFAFCTYSFMVILVVKRGSVVTDATAQIFQFVEDVHKVFLKENFTLGDTVETTEVRSFTTDAGFADPEGVAVFDIEVTFRRNFN